MRNSRWSLLFFNIEYFSFAIFLFLFYTNNILTRMFAILFIMFIIVNTINNVYSELHIKCENDDCYDFFHFIRSCVYRWILCNTPFYFLIIHTHNIEMSTKWFIACVHSVLPLPYLSHLVTEEAVVVSEGEAEPIGGKYQ